jgi:RNA polymerase-binding transcription factor DksA
MAARTPAKKGVKAPAAPAKKSTRASAPAKSAGGKPGTNAKKSGNPPKRAATGKTPAASSRQPAKAPSKSPAKTATKVVSKTPVKPSAKTTTRQASKHAPAKQPAKPVAKAPSKPAPKSAPVKQPAKHAAKPAHAPRAAQPAKALPVAPVPSLVDGIPKPKFNKEGIGYTKDFDLTFVRSQYELLQRERVHLTGQAKRLEAEAHQLVEEAEMGDVQFDDEGGEGDTMVVERERDLALSAQARDAVAEIDAALERISAGTYGYSIMSGRPIPKERLEAIPWSSVLVEEKVGGIGRR